MARTCAARIGAERLCASSSDRVALPEQPCVLGWRVGGRMWAAEPWQQVLSVSCKISSRLAGPDAQPLATRSRADGTRQITGQNAALKAPAPVAPAERMAALELTTVNGVTCVVPAFNASTTIDACLASLRAQRTDLPIEVVVVDDGSSDDTSVKARRWQARFARLHMSLRVIRQNNGGAARARNVGIEAAQYDWILTCDADDTSRFNRVEALRRAASTHTDAKNTLFGSRFSRHPPHATARYAAWANALSSERLVLERFRECTLIQPTWFFHRDVWLSAGRYDDDGEACDDLRFFLRHARRRRPARIVVIASCASRRWRRPGRWRRGGVPAESAAAAMASMPGRHRRAMQQRATHTGRPRRFITSRRGGPRGVHYERGPVVRDASQRSREM